MVDDGSGLHGVMDNIDVWTGEDGDDTKSDEEEVDKERKVHPSPYIQHSSTRISVKKDGSGNAEARYNVPPSPVVPSIGACGPSVSIEQKDNTLSATHTGLTNGSHPRSMNMTIHRHLLARLSLRIISSYRIKMLLRTVLLSILQMVRPKLS